MYCFFFFVTLKFTLHSHCIFSNNDVIALYILLVTVMSLLQHILLITMMSLLKHVFLVTMMSSYLLQTQCPHMVQLLHHYETANHRIYLLLEHVKGGRMVDLVAARRQQWELLRSAAINPPSSSSLLLRHNHQHTTSSSNQREKERNLIGEYIIH